MDERTLRQGRKPKNVMARNLALTGQVTHYFLSHPEVLASLPDSFELIILPENDPEIRLFNLDLLDRHDSEGKQVVFARLPAANQENAEPILRFYAPIAV